MTNDQVDVTPPTIVSIDPPSGSVMPVGQPAITFTFSEPIIWTDVWKVEFTVDIAAGGTPIAHETTETWYAPGVGVVRDKYREDRVEEGDEGWHTYDRWLDLMLDN